ncbi:hypothetical protein G6F24_016180 [Rhizopus arrhizus]|nr:hypothetical protein G6F24_016180 [Rhizopus arrhizus]
MARRRCRRSSAGCCPGWRRRRGCWRCPPPARPTRRGRCRACAWPGSRWPTYWRHQADIVRTIRYRLVKAATHEQQRVPAACVLKTPVTIAGVIPMAEIKEALVPDIGDYSDIPVIEVLVAVGDTVKKDQGLVTLESDKATMEVPSSVAGVVKELNA